MYGSTDDADLLWDLGIAKYQLSFLMPTYHLGYRLALLPGWGGRLCGRGMILTAILFALQVANHHKYESIILAHT